jgi:hypothetical protein
MLLVEDKMIGREPGKIVITCDACCRLLQADSDEWIDVWPRVGGRARSARSDANSAGSCVHLSSPTIKSGTGIERRRQATPSRILDRA